MPSFDRKKLFDLVRDSGLFGGKLQQENVDGINKVLEVWSTSPFRDLRHLAYILATARHETGDMSPKEEIGRGAGHDYGKTDPVTGKAYYGRGQVQLTWKENYARATKQINERNLVGRQVDLVAHPEQALSPDVSTAILIYGMEEGWFTGKKLSDYFNTKTDWVNARRIVNGTDRAELIAGYAMKFYSALTSSEVPDMPDPLPDTTRDTVLADLIDRIKQRTGAKSVVLDF